MISGVSSIPAGLPAPTPVLAPEGSSTAAAQAPMPADSVCISDQGQAFLKAELLGLALILALLSKPDKKEKASVLMTDLLITAIALQALANLSPFVQIGQEGGQNVYSLVGSVQAASEAATTNNMSTLFAGGVPAMAAALG